MSRFVSPELYHKYKQQVLELSPSIQYYEGTTLKRESSCFTDREIADRMGLEVDEVTEIRCIAEIDLLPADAWLKGHDWKREKVRQASKSEEEKKGKINRE